MNIERRLVKLEARKAEALALGVPVAVLRPIVTPGAFGPMVVGAMLRRAGEPWRHLTHEPGEALGAFMARA